jgi:hypothetical protein
MAKGVSDAAFGTIRWDEDHWEGTGSLPYFRGAGERVPFAEGEREGLPPVERLELSIQTGADQKRRPPDERQRAAWRAMRERGDALWDEAMDALVAEYRRQWPRRARYYRMVCGDEELRERMLPEHVDRATMRQMVVPQLVTVEWPDREDGTVDFFRVFIVTWCDQPLSVYVRDGRRVLDVVPMAAFLARRGRRRAESPVFGTISRGDRDLKVWRGEVEIEPFNTWAAVAVDRKDWDGSYDRRDERSSLPFHVARGTPTSLMIYGPGDELPTARQEAAFREATAPEAVGEVLRALLAYYREVAAERRESYKGADRDAAVPEVVGADGLRDITELDQVRVFPEEGDRPVAVGFEFRGSWAGAAGFFGHEGCGVRWRGGKVERVGDPRVVNPGSYQRLEKPQS